MDEQKRSALIAKISTRLSYDETWAKKDFVIAQCLVWAAIMASFICAIVAAGSLLPDTIVAFLAAIPGTVIVVDRSFSFAHRSRWHWAMYARLDQLLNDLQFRDANIEDVADKLSQLRIEMEEKFPGMSVEGLGNKFIK